MGLQTFKYIWQEFKTTRNFATFCVSVLDFFAFHFRLIFEWWRHWNKVTPPTPAIPTLQKKIQSNPVRALAREMPANTFCGHHHRHPNHHGSKPSVRAASGPAPCFTLLQWLHFTSSTAVCTGIIIGLFCKWRNWHSGKTCPKPGYSRVENWTQAIIWLQNLCLLAEPCAALSNAAVRLASHGWETRQWRAVQGSDLHSRVSSHCHHQGNF